MQSQQQLTNLYDLTQDDLRQFFIDMGEKPFRSTQMMKWLYQDCVSDFDDMTNLSKALRTRLKEVASIELPTLVTEQPSADGTHKWVLALADGNHIETVFIPEKGRGTLCVSSQVGCSLNCTFCSTATQGYNRNLTTGEIVGQVVFANLTLGLPENRSLKPVTNVVMMGMGEPLMNFDNVMKAMDVMNDDIGCGISKRRITLSTSGLVPQIRRMREHTDVSLAISLHAPNDELRNQLVPLNRKYPIAELLDACRGYIKGKARRRITFEYLLIDGVNDKPEHARQLARLLETVPAKINLIPFNPFPQSDFRRSSPDVIKAFQQILVKAGYTATIRKTRGDDIDAACGQLVGKVHDRTRRQQKYAEPALTVEVAPYD